MADENSGPEYSVGYKKPPHHTRFRKGGPSPNPAGRPKGSRSLKTDFLEELGEMVPVTEGGKRRKHSKQRVTLKALVNKGMAGDVRAATKVIELWIRLFGLDDANQLDSPVSATDSEILQAFLERYSAQDRP